MDLPDSLKVTELMVAMSPQERARATILIVDPDANDRQNLRNALKRLGFGQFTDVPTHAQGLEKFQERPVTHVIFDAKKVNYPPLDFLKKILELDSRIIAIPTSSQPQVDDVFDLLIHGARGYLCKPFTADTVDIAIVMATKGEPMSDSVLNAKDRNEALISIMMGSLDKAATLLRQATQFETAKREVPKAYSNMRRSAELAKLFCKGGTEGLLEALEKFCIERSKGPATKLGRLRRRLQTERKADDPENPSAPDTPQ